MAKVPSKIYARIKSKVKAGWVCSSIDFLDIGNRTAVNQALSRMVKDGLIRRVARGLYDIPQFNVMLNRSSPPRHDQVVMAIARRDGIKILTDNIVHANGLGLTNAVPAKLTYLTDGPSKTVSIGGFDIRMKHVAPSFMNNATSKSGPLFQALLWLGKDIVNSSNNLPKIIQSKVRDDVLVDIKKRVKHLPVWMRPVVNEIAKCNEDWVRQLSRDVAKKDFVSGKVKVEVMQEFEKKSYRQAKFKESCRGLSAEEVMDRASLFSPEDIAKLKIVKMVG